MIQVLIVIFKKFYIIQKEIFCSSYLITLLNANTLSFCCSSIDNFNNINALIVRNSWANAKEQKQVLNNIK